MAKPDPKQLKKEGEELKSLFAKIKKKQHNCAILLAKDGVVIEAHIKKSPEILVKLAKKKGGMAKGAWGTITMDGQVLKLDPINDKVPGNLPKTCKSYLGARGLKNRLEVLEPDVDTIIQTGDDPIAAVDEAVDEAIKKIQGFRKKLDALKSLTDYAKANPDWDICKKILADVQTFERFESEANETMLEGIFIQVEKHTGELAALRKRLETRSNFLKSKSQLIEFSKTHIEIPACKNIVDSAKILAENLPKGSDVITAGMLVNIEEAEKALEPIRKGLLAVQTRIDKLQKTIEYAKSNSSVKEAGVVLTDLKLVTSRLAVGDTEMAANFCEQLEKSVAALASIIAKKSNGHNPSSEDEKQKKTMARWYKREKQGINMALKDKGSKHHKNMVKWVKAYTNLLKANRIKDAQQALDEVALVLKAYEKDFKLSEKQRKDAMKRIDALKDKIVKDLSALPKAEPLPDF